MVPPWLLPFAAFLSIYAVLTREAMLEFSLSDMEDLLRKRKRSKEVMPRVEAFAERIDGYQLSFLLLSFLSKAMAALGLYELVKHHDDPLVGWTLWGAGFAGFMLLADVIVRPFAAAHAELLTLVLLRTWQVTHLILLPISWGFRTVHDGLRRLTRGNDAESHAEDQAEDEIMATLALGELQGHIDEEERSMVESILALDDRNVEAVMTPRTDMDAIAIEDGIHGALERVRISGHSRLPVYEGNRDNILGIFHVKDAIRPEGILAIDLRSVLRPALFVPATKNVRELLAELRRDRIHMAVVLDEYGGTSGLVTLEDIIEEVFGDIADEFDVREAEEMRHLSEHVMECDARVKVAELNEKLEINLPESENYESVGGLISAQLGRIPTAGEHWQHEEVLLTVLEATDRKVVRLRVEKKQHEEEQ